LFLLQGKDSSWSFEKVIENRKEGQQASPELLGYTCNSAQRNLRKKILGKGNFPSF